MAAVWQELDLALGKGHQIFEHRAQTVTAGG